jgi:hypothetical protein
MGAVARDKGDYGGIVEYRNFGISVMKQNLVVSERGQVTLPAAMRKLPNSTVPMHSCRASAPRC